MNFGGLFKTIILHLLCKTLWIGGSVRCSSSNNSFNNLQTYEISDENIFCVFSVHVFVECVFSVRRSRVTSGLRAPRDTRDIPLLAETMLFLLSRHVSTPNTKNIPFRETRGKHDCSYWTCLWVPGSTGREALCTVMVWNEMKRIINDTHTSCSCDCDIRCQMLSPHLCSALEKLQPSYSLVKGQQEALSHTQVLLPCCLSLLSCCSPSFSLSDPSCCCIEQMPGGPWC